MAEKLELEDFSGGITDYYLSAPPNKMKQCDNLLINQYQNQGKVFTRPGSELWDLTAPLPDANRINTCFYYKDTLFVQMLSKLYYYKSTVVNATSLVANEVYKIKEVGSTNFVALGASKNEAGIYFKYNGVAATGSGTVYKGIWQEVLGQNGNKAFPLSLGEHQFTYDNWNYHTLIANSSLPGYPMKVLQNGSSVSIVQSGLPLVDVSSVVFSGYAPGANNYLYKFVYRREYTVGKYDPVVKNVFNLIENKIYRINSIGTTNFTLLGATSNTVGLYFVSNGVNGSGLGTGTVTETNSDFFVDLGPTSKAMPLQTAAIGPSNDVNIDGFNKPIIVATAILVGQQYEIRSIGTTDFTLIGAPSNTIGVKFFATGIGSGSGEVYQLLNTTETNWDDSQIKIDIYRTTNNGTNYYLLTTVSSDVVGIIDSTLDADLILKEPLYTNGGVVSNDTPPKCRSIHIRNDIAYYGGILGQSYRLLQSIAGDIDSVPETFYVDVDDEIVAVSSTKNNVIILCKEKVYRVDGFFDELGRGGMVVERINDTAGCIGVNTPVQALDGVLWLGKDAVYFTDGFKVIKLNQDYDITYKTFTENDTNNLKYQGKYDNKKNRVWWTIQEDGQSDLNKCYVLDLNWGISNSSTFTTASGDSFMPSAIEFINGNMIRCDKNGYVLIHRDNLFVDPKIDTSTIALNWRDEAIVYSMETSAYNFGTSAVRKYVTQANVTCESTTNLALQIVSNNDDNRIISNLLPIRYRGNILWGEPDVYWGDITLEWDRQGLIHEKRLMPAKNLRCNYKSLKFTNAHVAIVNSDLIGTANVNPGLKTATLSNAVYDWPTKSIGYFISFEFDNYTKEYEIIGRSADILTFYDPLNNVVGGTAKWVIRGRPLGEVLRLLNVSIIYDVAGPSQGAFKVSGSGEVQS